MVRGLFNEYVMYGSIDCNGIVAFIRHHYSACLLSGCHWPIISNPTVEGQSNFCQAKISHKTLMCVTYIVILKSMCPLLTLFVSDFTLSQRPELIEDRC